MYLQSLVLVLLAVNFATSGYVPQATEFTEVENVRPKVTNANEEKVDSVSEKQSPVVVSTENSVKTAEKSDSSPVASMATSVSTTEEAHAHEETTDKVVSSSTKLTSEGVKDMKLHPNWNRNHGEEVKTQSADAAVEVPVPVDDPKITKLY
ncbi:uncharacterized protein LOC113373205 [Ctenocephalides felis]|uniref:uncharacterized protein LOC113373205 n=1 Tax=Ctenocephalides felis TaxID=7515 RepID=UPI000E6E5526|nr:uncharacterized protein LOC113373205 [Ctenocephalides felis]